MFVYNRILVAVWLATVASGQDLLTCHPGWTFYHGSCYVFGESPVTWANAEELCRDFGGNLAEVESADENTFLSDMTRNKSVTGAWLGGTDIFDEGNWSWAQSGRRIYEFLGWGPGQPDEAGSGEDCLAIWQGNSYQWNDAPCHNILNFICEGELLNSEIMIG